MNFIVGSIVFVGGCVAALAYLGLTWQAGLGCACALLLGGKIAK